MIYTENELEDLYEKVVIKHIKNQTNKIAYLYRHKHPEDFEDIQQLISIDMWKVLERLLLLVEDNESFIKLLSSAVNFSFKTHYTKLKKEQTNFSKINIEDHEILAPDNIQKVDILLDLNENVKNLSNKIKKLNRYNGKEGELVCYIIDCLLLNREPGKKILHQIYNTRNVPYYIQYADVLIRTVLSRVAQLK